MSTFMNDFLLIVKFLTICLDFDRTARVLFVHISVT